MAEQQWYYAEQGQQRGPAGIEALQRMISEGRVAAATLVWREGMATWEPAGTIPELFADRSPGPQPAQLPYGQASIQYYNPAQAMAYLAGFWLRVAAYIIDYLVLLIPNVIFSQAAQFARMGPRLAGPRPSPFWAISLAMGGGIAQWVVTWLYFALMESSSKQASLGKMACGIIVTDLAGNRISFARATGRHFASWISSMILGIGFLMAAWTEKKQTLHDIIAGTLVVRKMQPQG